ncbi:hypothetical protein ADUPG1_005286, partial [Aduncisulcus paluster]
ALSTNGASKTPCSSSSSLGAESSSCFTRWTQGMYVGEIVEVAKSYKYCQDMQILDRPLMKRRSACPTDIVNIVTSLVMERAWNHAMMLGAKREQAWTKWQWKRDNWELQGKKWKEREDERKRRKDQWIERENRWKRELQARKKEEKLRIQEETAIKQEYEAWKKEMEGWMIEKKLWQEELDYQEEEADDGFANLESPPSYPPESKLYSFPPLIFPIPKKSSVFPATISSSSSSSSSSLVPTASS